MGLKVIGAGLPRTGTTSLQLALEQLLGGRCYHMTEVFEHPEHVRFWRAAADGEAIAWDELFSGYVAAVDTPSCLFWPELMQAYPDALVVLSIRDARSWFESCKKTIFAARSKLTRDRPEWREMMEAVTRSRLPFRLRKSPDAEIDAFERHNDAVRTGVPAQRLLVWQAQDGWAPLCAALKLPVPSEPFPQLNTRSMWRYRAILELGRNLIGKTTGFLASRRG